MWELLCTEEVASHEAERSRQERMEREPMRSLSPSHKHPALGGREGRSGTAKETEKVQPEIWENRDSRLSMDEENFAGKAGKRHSRWREQHRKGSGASVNEPYLERGETRAASPSTPGHTGARPVGIWAECEPMSKDLCVTWASVPWSQWSLLP